jgi:hypothetical protein
VGGHKLPIRPAGAAGGSLSTSSVTANIRPNSVNDGAQTGETGTKGGGSYDDEVCEEGTSVWSPTILQPGPGLKPIPETSPGHGMIRSSLSSALRPNWWTLGYGRPANPPRPSHRGRGARSASVLHRMRYRISKELTVWRLIVANRWSGRTFTPSMMPKCAVGRWRNVRAGSSRRERSSHPTPSSLHPERERELPIRE